MTSWQAAQTTRVLRRILAMTVAHLGWSGPGLPRLASLRIWWTTTLVTFLHSSHRRERRRRRSSLRGVGTGPGTRSVRTAFFLRASGIPPKVATRSGLPSRWILAWKQVRSPCGVSMVVLYLVAIFATLDWYFVARVFSIDVLAYHWSVVSRHTSWASRESPTVPRYSAP